MREGAQGEQGEGGDEAQRRGEKASYLAGGGRRGLACCAGFG
jgi:hypothetical protein